MRNVNEAPKFEQSEINFPPKKISWEVHVENDDIKRNSQNEKVGDTIFRIEGTKCYIMEELKSWEKFATKLKSGKAFSVLERTRPEVTQYIEKMVEEEKLGNLK